LVTDQVRTRRRVGAIEAWGRGTNRVIDECKNYGIDPPTFELRGNSVVVTFRAQIALGPDLVPKRDQVGTKLGPSWDQAGTKLEPSQT
jgi:predicted HTH transcriptional regulator